MLSLKLNKMKILVNLQSMTTSANLKQEYLQAIEMCDSQILNPIYKMQYNIAIHEAQNAFIK